MTKLHKKSLSKLSEKVLTSQAREIKEEIAELAHTSGVKNHITIEITTSKDELEKGYAYGS